MKRRPLQLRSTPAVTSLCAIGMVVLWYLSLVQDNGTWTVKTVGFSFEGYSAFGIFTQVITLFIPVFFFSVVLFLAERSLRWVIVPLLLPVAHQISNAVFYIEQPDVILANPMQLILPFLAVILYALTVERVLPSRWIFVAACLIFALTPPVMALLHVGEFSYTVDVFDATLYTHVPHVIVDWSAVLNLSLYYLGLAVLGIQMKEAPAEESAAEEKTTPGEPEPAPAEPETPEV